MVEVSRVGGQVAAESLPDDRRQEVGGVLHVVAAGVGRPFQRHSGSSHHGQHRRRQERERLDDAARTDWRAYDKGKKVGDGISLATQVGGSSSKPTAALEG